MCYLMFIINHLVKKINGNNNLFFHLYFFNTGFTKNTKKVLDHDKMDKL